MKIKAESEAMASAFAARSTQELSQRYAEWAQTYDAENAAAGFRMPQMCSAFFARHVEPGSQPILDAGCGHAVGSIKRQRMTMARVERYVRLAWPETAARADALARDSMQPKTTLAIAQYPAQPAP